MGKLSDQILADLKGKKAGPPVSPMKAGGGPPVPFSSKAKGSPMDDGGDEPEGGDYAGDEVSIAGDINAAIAEGDDQALADALKSFIDVCTTGRE